MAPQLLVLIPVGVPVPAPASLGKLSTYGLLVLDGSMGLRLLSNRFTMYSPCPHALAISNRSTQHRVSCERLLGAGEIGPFGEKLRRAWTSQPPKAPHTSPCLTPRNIRHPIRSWSNPDRWKFYASCSTSIILHTLCGRNRALEAQIPPTGNRHGAAAALPVCTAIVSGLRGRDNSCRVLAAMLGQSGDRMSTGGRPDPERTWAALHGGCAEKFT